MKIALEGYMSEAFKPVLDLNPHVIEQMSENIRYYFVLHNKDTF